MAAHAVTQCNNLDSRGCHKLLAKLFNTMSEEELILRMEFFIRHSVWFICLFDKFNPAHMAVQNLPLREIEALTQ